jgi:hypothetical protein
MRRWLLRALVAGCITAALVYVVPPGSYLQEQFESYRLRLMSDIAGVLVVVFLLVVIGDHLLIWATRGERVLRTAGLVSLFTGLASGLFAATLWFAFLSVPIAPVGIAAAIMTLRREKREQSEGHSIANLIGLVLNLTALGVFVSQIRIR